MDYPLISADDHLDLQYLPSDLWTARLPKSLRDRAPRVVDGGGGAAWVCDGGVWGRWAGRRRASRHGPRRRRGAGDPGARLAMSLIPFYGEGHLLWASDYPHPDSTWPNSRKVIDKQMGHLSPEVRRQLTRDNAAALYGL